MKDNKKIYFYFSGNILFIPDEIMQYLFKVSKGDFSTIHYFLKIFPGDVIDQLLVKILIWKENKEVCSSIRFRLEENAEDSITLDT